MISNVRSWGDNLMTLAEKLREEGLKEGLEKGKLEVARNAIKEGMELNLIAKLTGLPKKEIEKIAAEMDN
jgi:predicted transposase/invertase (TIGR01784 family)